MTELEQRLVDMLEQEKQDKEKERKELIDYLTTLQKQNQQIIELLSKESGGGNIEEILEKLLGQFQTNLTASLFKLFKE